MPRPEKIRIVEDMTESFKSAGSIFVTDYAGLKVSDMTELRTRLREAGVRYRIVKNTFLRRAADNAGLSELSVYFKGPTAVALGPADPIPAAKVLDDFASRLELPSVRAFIVEKKSYGPDDVKTLARLTSREALLSELVSSVEAPITGFIGTLDGIIREFIGTVDAIAARAGESA